MKYINKLKEQSLFIITVLLVLVIQSINKEFLTLENLSDMLKNTAVLSILAVGMMMVIITRGIDLSVGSTLALSGMGVALLVSKYPNLHPIVALFVGIGIGTLCGLLLGVVIAKGKVLPIIATLGMMNVYRGVTFLISKGSWVSAHQMPASFKAIGTGTILGVNNLIVIAVVILAIAAYFLLYTRTGRRIYAVGSNPESAILSGIKIEKVQVLVYTIMGALAGLSGVLWVAKFASAQGDTATGYELKVIAACVLGGISIAGGEGKILGVIGGVLILGILDNALPLVDLSPFWQSLIQGLVIIFAVIAGVLVKRKNNALVLQRRVL